MRKPSRTSSWSSASRTRITAPGEIDEEVRELLVRLSQPLDVAAVGIEELAVDVELGLVPRPVAYPYGPAVAVAAKMRQLALGEVALAGDPVHDLERTVLVHVASGCLGHPGDEVLYVVGAGADPECVEREARVADPRVAVVPGSSRRSSRLNEDDGGSAEAARPERQDYRREVPASCLCFVACLSNEELCSAIPAPSFLAQRRKGQGRRAVSRWSVLVDGQGDALRLGELRVPRARHVA